MRQAEQEARAGLAGQEAIGRALERAPRPERAQGPEWTAWAPGPEWALEQTLWAPGPERTAWAPRAEQALERTLWAPGPERTAWAPGTERTCGLPDQSGLRGLTERSGLCSRLCGLTGSERALF